MTIPEKIPIERIEDYHTHYLGQSSDGKQFWAHSTHVFVKTYAEILEIQGDWQDYRHEYAVLHTFDKDGNHLTSNCFNCGTSKDVTDKMLYDKLEEMVCQLGVIEFKDIEIKPFQSKIDDIIYGLVPDENNEYINLEPNSQISFVPPWDGTYST